MPTLTKANEAKRAAHLSKPVRSARYGVLTLGELIKRRLEDGGRLEVAEIDDPATRARLEREYSRMNRGFNVPWGNERHPTTIKAQALRDQLAGRITKLEYRIYDAFEPDVYYVLSKTAFEYAQSLA